jgi:hypothetical protein
MVAAGKTLVGNRFTAMAATDKFEQAAFKNGSVIAKSLRCAAQAMRCAPAL